MSDKTQFQTLSEEIAKSIFNAMEPEIHQAMIEMIIHAASEKWLYRWQHEQLIGEMITKAIGEAIEGKYKPVLDYVADKKAREKVMRRAEQNGMKREEILPLFELIEKKQE
jgi:hypothetical protein